MTKVLRCRDVGMDCDFEARGETDQEILRQCQQHARTDHGMDQIPHEVAVKLKNAIRDEKAA
jgi:predicted small metal-binding protein